MSNQLVVSLPSPDPDSFLVHHHRVQMLKIECHSQGSVYQRIMDDVIDSCQVTFEEDGVNQQTLDDLRKVGSLLAFHTYSPRYALRVNSFWR